MYMCMCTHAYVCVHVVVCICMYYLYDDVDETILKNYFEKTIFLFSIFKIVLQTIFI